MTPTEARYSVNGIELCVFEWPGEGPPLLFAHGTSFHARCWDQVIARLPGRHVYSIDMRGHGRSDKPEPPYPSEMLGQDVAELADALGLEGAIGIGHSMGGHSMMLAAALRPARFAALLLVDPVIMPAELLPSKHPGEGERFSSRRRAEWSSPDEMFEAFRTRPPFTSWDEAALRDYCQYGLLPAPEGEGFVLACPPAIEAEIYRRWDGELSPLMASVRIPVRVLRARSRKPGEEGFGGSPTLPDLASRVADGEDFQYEDRSHFLPMEAPELVAEHVQAMIERAGDP